jgi:hypothetical protein
MLQFFRWNSLIRPVLRLSWELHSLSTETLFNPQDISQLFIRLPNGSTFIQHFCDSLLSFLRLLKVASARITAVIFRLEANSTIAAVQYDQYSNVWLLKRRTNWDLLGRTGTMISCLS